jgi:hypothetical protein
MGPLRCHIASLRGLSGNAMNAGDAIGMVEVNLCSADGFIGTHNMLGLIRSALLWLPCIHRYAKVWICVGPPEITRVESYSIDPLRIFPHAKCVAVREDVAAM